MPTATLHTCSRLTQASLQQVISYDPETGDFTWRVVRKGYGGGVWPGKPAGQINKYGYLVLCVDQERHFAHRLAFLYMTSAWPVEEIDHINRVPGDNRWANLRIASASQNKQNTKVRRDNLCGVKGVYFDKNRARWVARLKIHGKVVFQGRFDTLEEAATARRAAEAQHFGEFAPC